MGLEGRGRLVGREVSELCVELEVPLAWEFKEEKEKAG